MQVDVSYNDEKNGIELLFSEKLPEDISIYLKGIGFKDTFKKPLKWYVTQHPAYKKYAEDLKEALANGKPFKSVLIQPSYSPSEENIDHNKFSYVTISFLTDGAKEQESFVVFDPYKRVATEIGTRYGINKYGSSFKEIDVSPRNYKRKARTLLKEGKIITPEIGSGMVNQATKDKLVKHFIKFANKRRSESDVIQEQDLPILFKSWLRANNPIYLEYSEEIWNEYLSVVDSEKPETVNQKDSVDENDTQPKIDTLESFGFKGLFTVEEAFEKPRLVFDLQHRWYDAYGHFQENIEKPALEEIKNWNSEIAILKGKRDAASNETRKSLKEKIDHKQRELQKVFMLVENENTRFQEKLREGLLERAKELGHSFESEEMEAAFVDEIMTGLLDERMIESYYKQPIPIIADQIIQHFFEPPKNSEPWKLTQREYQEQKAIEKTGSPMVLDAKDRQEHEKIIEKALRDKIPVPETVLEDYPWLIETNETNEESHSAVIDRPNDYIYQDFSEFEVDVIYQIEVQGEMTTSDAQGIIMVPDQESFVKSRWEELLNPTPIEAMAVAKEILDKSLVKEKDKPTDPLTNSSGVYTEETAGDNLETIVVDLPATSKVEIEVKIAKDSDDLFRYGLHVQKNFGDHSGGGGYPSVNDPTFPSRSEALKSALGKALDELNTLHESEDSILNNEEKKKKLIAKAIVALSAYSKNIFKPDDKTATTPTNTKAIAVDIESRGVSVPNVLVPALSKEPFISGNIYFANRSNIEKASPSLWEKKDSDLQRATATELFEMSQLPHPNEYGIDVKRGKLLKIWVSKGEKLLENLGFPTDKNYPYVNVHSGYKSVDTLEDILEPSGDSWWSVVEHYRPIADLDKAISFIESEVKRVDSERQELINPKTKKPTAKNKDQFNKLTWLIDNLEGGKQIVKDYLSSSSNKDEPTEKPPLPPSESDDYIDRVIAHMHDEYELGKRVTKGQIEKLAAQLKVPNMGKMWEAVELSWLLWYKMLYNEHSVFERRLAKMIVFWHKIQPTYAYSDSSKEIYKQYSTPCPIAAIIAQYTLMDKAQSIFEPSAGNGLLVLGADPKKTHVNEIDKTRLESLRHQEFYKVTNLNASQPFPEEMTKAYDVVVTNPPFAKWEEEKFDKDYIIGKYFHNHIGLAGNIRLEHLMAGLALHTMKDTGRAAIIIMGHVYFDKDTFIAKYRPFFNWLYRHYQVDDVINMNSFKLYNKQGAIEKTMLILIGGRKATPKGVSPTSIVAPHLYDMVDSFEELWQRLSPHISYNINTVIKQLKLELGR